MVGHTRVILDKFCDTAHKIRHFLLFDFLQKLEKYDEAIQYFNRAGAIGTPFYDELYCKAMLYEKIGKDKDAYKLYQEIAEKLRKNGFDVEAGMAEESAKRLDMKKN